MTRSAEYWIEKLGLQPHPEGGFFKEIYRSEEMITETGLPSRFPGARPFATSIYFLLRSEDISVFHRIKSDELWHFYQGSSLTIYIINPEGELIEKKLGDNPENGESLFHVVPANSWFGAKVNEPYSYTLVGCNVAPGFDFHDFEMGEKEKLLKEYPKHDSIINLLS